MADAQTATDNNGQYSFTGLRAGTYAVEISGFDMDEVGFGSVSGAATVGVGESKIVSFDGTYLRTAGIMGQVSVEGTGLAGVTVSLAGEGDPRTEITDAGGQYAFSKLKAGDYSVAISGYDPDDYEFATTSMSVSVATGETANVPFDGVLLRTAGISGRVSVEGMGISGVTVTLAGTAEATTDTDASGQYAFAGLVEGTYVVSISNPDEVSYSFDEMMATIVLADSQAAIQNFEGTHTRTASVSGVMFLDEEPNDGMYTANEPAFAHADIPVILQGPGVTDVAVGATDETGAFTFGELRAGTYRVLVDLNDDVAAMLAAGGFAFGGDLTGAVVTVAAGAKEHVAFPFNITMQTLVTGARMGGGDHYGAPVEGVELVLYARANMTDMLGEAETDEMGVAKFDFARADNTGPAGNDNIVFVSVKSSGHDALVPSGNEFVEIAYAGTARAYQADMEKEVATLVNVQANFQFWIKSDKDARSGNMGLGGWNSVVMMGDSEDALMTLDEDGEMTNLTMPTDTAMGANLGKATATYTVDPTMLPAVFTVVAADAQAMARREKWEQSDALTHTHTGLELPAMNTAEMNDQGPIYVTFLTQTLTVGVYREADDVPGMSDYRSGVKGGDQRPDAAVAKEMGARVMVGATGRRGLELYDEWDHDRNPKTPARDASLAFTGGQVSFGNLPAGMDFTVEFDAGADRLAVGGPDARSDRVETFGDDVEMGHSVGAFGDGSGAGPEVRLCPLSVDDDPMDDEDPMCATFGYQWTTGTITGRVGSVKGAPVTFAAVTDNHSEPPRNLKSGTGGGFRVSGVQDGEYEVSTPKSTATYQVSGSGTKTVSVYHDEAEDDEDEDTEYVGTAGGGMADFSTSLRGLSIKGYAANISHANNEVVRGDETVEGAELELWAYNPASKSKTTRTKGKVLATTTVQADGSYGFDDLDAGWYVIIAKNTDDYEMLRGGPDVHYAQPVAADTYKDVEEEELKLPYWDYEASVGMQLRSGHTVGTGAAAESFTFQNFALLHGDGEFSGRVREARGEPSGIAVELRRCVTTELDADGDAVKCKEEVDFDAENESADSKGRWEFPGLREGYYVANIAATTYNRAKWGDDGIDDDAMNCEGGADADADCDLDRTEDAYGMLEGSRAFNRGGANFYVYNRTLDDDDDMDGVDAEGTMDPDDGDVALAEGDSDDAITFASKSITVEPDGVDSDASFVVTTGTGRAMKYWPVSSKGVATVGLGYNKTGSADEGADPKGTVITVSVTAENGYNDEDETFTYYRSNPVGNTLVASDFDVEDPATAEIEADRGVIDQFTVNVAEDAEKLTFTVTLEDTETQGLVVMMGGDAVDVADRKTNDGAHEMRYELTLAAGANTVDLTVTSEDDVEKDYQLVVRRADAPALSDDATLSALSLSEGTLSPAFASGVTSYTATVANSIDETTVTATANDGAATVAYGGAAGTDGVAALDVGANAIMVTVTAEDGSTEGYTVTVTREAPGVSSDADLSDLSLSPGTLSPTFDAATTSYTASVANAVSTVMVTAAPNHSSASVAQEPANPVELTVGPTTITVTVTAGDGTTMKEYTVTVTRAGPGASTVATLSSLSLSGVTLNEDWAATTYAYTADVGNSVESTTVAATATDDAATVMLPDPNPVALAEGATTITVTVTAGDGTTTQAYTVTVTRAAAPATAGLLLSIGDVTVMEGTERDYTVRLTTQPSGDVSVAISVAAHADNPTAVVDHITTTRTSLVFNEDNWSRSRTVTITVGEDDNESSEIANINHAVSGAGSYLDIDSVDVKVTASDDDVVAGAAIRVDKTTVRITEDGDDGEVMVRLAAAPMADVTVTVVSSDVEIATVAPADFTFTDANWDDEQTIMVTASSDDDPADTEATVTISAAGGGYGSAKAVEVAITVEDDEEATISVTDNFEDAEIVEGGTLEYTISLSAPPPEGEMVRVNLQVVGLATLSTAQVMFTSTTALNTIPVTVTTLGDSDSQDETLVIRHTVDADVGSGYESAEAPANIGVTVKDDEAAGVVVSRTSLSVEEGGTAMYSVRLTKAPSDAETVTVHLAGTGVNLDPVSLEFTANTFQVAQDVTVTGHTDSNSVDDQATVVHTVVAAGGGKDYEGVTASTVRITVTEPSSS